MCERKKTTYYYTPETEELINRGIERFSKLSPTGTLTLTGFIDICIRKAVKEDPEQMASLMIYADEQRDEMIDVIEKLKKYREVVRFVKKIENFKAGLMDRIQEVINLE